MTRSLSIVVLSLVLSVPAMAYTVVNTSAPQINCVFTPTCSIPILNHVYTLSNGGKISTRIFQGQSGAPAYGKWVYIYRVDMTNAVGVLNIPYVSGMSIGAWGPVLSFDYNFDSVATDQVFVVTAGGSGTIGLSSAGWFWGVTYFTFSSPIYGGSQPGQGQSSYFFGLTSDHPPVIRNATVQTANGTVTVTVYAPLLP